MKAVIDTNVFVSGIFWKGTPNAILMAWRRHEFQLVLSAPILDEYYRVLQILNADKTLVDVEEVMEIVSANSIVVAPSPFTKQVCSDPDDDKFLEAAISGNAQYVVSGDKALLAVKELAGVVVVSPKQFLDILLKHRQYSPQGPDGE